MDQVMVLAANFMSYSYIFVIFFILITVSAHLKDKKLTTRRLVQSAILIVSFLGHSYIGNRLMWDATPNGRFLLTGMATMFYGPVVGMASMTANITFGKMFGFDNMIVLIGCSIIYMGTFLIYKELTKEFKIKWHMIGLPVLVLVTGILAYLFSMSEPNPIKNVSNLSIQMLIFGWFLQSLLIGTAGYTEIREEEWSKTNTELESKVARRTKELKALNQGLQEEIAERRKAEVVMEKAQKDAIYANKAKSEFLANMSHEIRTPINAIMGFNHLLGNTQLTTQQKNYLKKTNDSSGHLLNVINDILDFSKIEADQMLLRIKKENIYKIINSVFDNVMYEMYQKKLAMVFDIDPKLDEFMLIDGNKLQQIMLNLVSNAVKFTESGQITLSAKYLNNKGPHDWLRVRIKDTGIGISNENQKKLFSAFSQVEGDLNRRYGGTGLGLSISKSLVEMMGGTINVESKLGVGSEFTFDVRIEKTQNAPNFCLPSPIRVAVITEKSLNESIISMQLKKLGCKVVLYDYETAQRDEFNPELFEKIFVECVKYDKFKSEYFEDYLKDLKQGEKVYVTNYFRYEGAHKVEQLGVAKAVLFYPVGIESLYHQLVDKIEVDQAGINSSYDFKYSNKSVLLVEDNEINQIVGREILVDKGLEVIVANNGSEAIDLVKEREFDLILMDIHMPVMDGIEATKIIRSMPSLQKIPIIAMTADTMVDKSEYIQEVGLSDYILKPIDVNQMFMIIEQYI